MATVTNTVKLPDGSIPSRVDVTIELVASTTSRAAGWVTATDATLLSVVRPTVTNGAWSASLTPNADITPSGTVYKITEYADKVRYTHYITVDSDGGSVFDLLTDAPTSLTPTALAAVAARVTTAESDIVALTADYVDVPAVAFSVASGASFSLLDSRAPAWHFDADAAGENVVAMVTGLPSHWTSVDFDLYWANSGAGSGNVVWQLSAAQYQAGDDIGAAPSSLGNVTATASTQGVIVSTELASAYAINPALILYLRVLRSGSAGGDTLTNDAGVMFLRIRDASA